MKKWLLLIVVGTVATAQAKDLLPQDAHLAGEYVMAAYHAKLLSESYCGKYV